MKQDAELLTKFKDFITSYTNSYKLLEKLVSVDLFEKIYKKVNPVYKIDLGIKSVFAPEVYSYYFLGETDERRRKAAIHLMKEIILTYNALYQLSFLSKEDLDDLSKNSLFIRLLKIMLSKGVILRIESNSTVREGCPYIITAIALEPGLDMRSKYIIEIAKGEVRLCKGQDNDKIFINVNFKMCNDERLDKNQFINLFKKLINEVHKLEFQVIECKVCKAKYRKVKEMKHYTCKSCKQIMNIIAEDRGIKFSEVSFIVARKLNAKKHPKTDKEIFSKLYEEIVNSKLKQQVKILLNKKYGQCFDSDLES